MPQEFQSDRQRSDPRRTGFGKVRIGVAFCKSLVAYEANEGLLSSQFWYVFTFRYQN